MIAGSSFGMPMGGAPLRPAVDIDRWLCFYTCAKIIGLLSGVISLVQPFPYVTPRAGSIVVREHGSFVDSFASLRSSSLPKTKCKEKA